ncbi:glycine cleavage system aminomethyltransferase GcvT [Propionimicrobium sp. PCR01-08-3]|uniref:glycine cleavage system aminomethyltransferase GcvT n=1 Tax=Propionimicrobium sp. PCR01-08-3 TaxID=3052086 RepID=UPI00255C4AB2|nr:glycine cleavage system aminomethyltransferase GcvT [Propionimicrobium sp. PCR01-08-3]WIY81692.1 glycine cleavage system aminomethyltransferase GcvT [Propionimicrobium sp. PCR01-08-3]
MPTQALQHSPLYEWHVAAGAKMAPFGGWEMPVEYAGAGVLAEHAAVREKVGLFDVSHLGKLHVTGPGAVDYLNSRLANDLRKVGPGKAQYTLLCDQDGGAIDDLIAYLHDDDDVLLIPNAANASTVAQVLADGAPGGLSIDDLHTERAVIVVSGPRSDELLSSLGLPTRLSYMAFQPFGEKATICRTGYTGERGCELVVESSQAERWWTRLLDAGDSLGVQACGLGARDTLRTEMGYALHGHELSLDIDPVTAGLSWAIGWSKPAFDGRDALLAIREQGPARKSWGIKATGRGIPRPGMDVLDDDSGEVVGVVTSGTFSPTLHTGVGLALVDTGLGAPGRVGVQIRRRAEEFELVKPPFVKPRLR